jgi:hypothetical protein
MIPAIFAQEMPPADALKSWLGVAFWLIGSISALSFLALNIKQLRASDKQETLVTPQPLITKSEVRMATHEELRGIENRVERLERQDGERMQLLASTLSKLDEKNEERASKTHERINLLLGAISEMRGEIKRLPCSACEIQHR